VDWHFPVSGRRVMMGRSAKLRSFTWPGKRDGTWCTLPGNRGMMISPNVQLASSGGQQRRMSSPRPGPGSRVDAPG
jgi:hypothetical protein